MARIPVKEGTFEDAPGGSLLGNKCSKCGQVFYPKAPFCFTCSNEDMKDIKLSRKAKLNSYTINRMPSAHFQPPQPVGYLDLPEKIRVFAPLVEVPDKPFKIGMEMEIVIDKLWQEGEDDVVGYRFKPV